MKKKFLAILLIPCFLLIGCKSTKTLQSFVVNYGTVNPKEIAKKDMAILEPDNYTHNQILNLKKTGVKIIGYVSLGEVNPDRWYYPLLKKRGLLGKNKNWNSYYINLKDSISRNIILNKVIPNIIYKGFDGLFLDTVDDVSPYTKRSSLQKYMAGLIKSIRSRYPKIIIIQNDGLFLLNKTYKEINGVLIEDVASKYNFKNKSYSLSSVKWYKKKVDSIRKYGNKYQMHFYIVDYANTKKLYNKIAQRLDTLKFPFYISKINLQ